MTYPILVERYQGDQALRIRCTTCGKERVVGSEAIISDGLYDCPASCGGTAEHKYIEADRCPNCDALGFWPANLDRCCSRVCKLQQDYARSLEAA